MNEKIRRGIDEDYTTAEVCSQHPKEASFTIRDILRQLSSFYIQPF